MRLQNRSQYLLPFIATFLCLTLLAVVRPVFALELTASGSAKVTATVPEQSFNPPELLTPYNNSSVTSKQPSFYWLRPDPLPSTPLSHYDFYLDDQVIAQNISDSLTLSEYYFYRVQRYDNKFQLDLKYDLAEGYHTWKVVAYNQNNLSATSETWLFYLDASTPYIKLTKVDSQILNWDTGHYQSIPSEEKRYLYVSESPLLTGEVETGANLQFYLKCPGNLTPCTDLYQTYSYPTSNWQHRFYHLTPNKAYPVYLTAVDAAGNVNNFPVFYLIYFVGSAGVTITPYPTATIPPTPPVTPTRPLPTPTINDKQPFPSIEPIPTPILIEFFVPSSFTPAPPVTPTKPPQRPTTPAPQKYNFVPVILLILIFGLPLHLLLTQFGTGTPITLTFQFIFSLIFPFVGKNNFETQPFSSITFYLPNDLSKPWRQTVSNVIGRYSLPDILPVDLFTKISLKEHHFKSTIIKSEILPTICLLSLLEDHRSTQNRLQNTAMSIRSIPLAFGTFTSLFALFYIPNLGILLYLYLCLQAAFSEYLYPRLEK